MRQNVELDVAGNSQRERAGQQPESRSTIAAGPGGLELTVDPGSLARSLTWLVILIAAVGSTANYLIYNVAPDPEHRIARVLRRLDLGHEPSIPAFYSSLALMACAVLLGVIAVSVWRSSGDYFRSWLGLSILFVLLAIDETIMVHEMVDTALHESLGLGGIFYFAWVIPGSIFAALFAAAYLKFLLHLDSLTRWRFVTAGALFVLGAVGMEMVAGLIADSSLGLQSVAHTISQTVEESLEMLSVVLFIFALLDYMHRNIGPIRISWAGIAVVHDDDSEPSAGGAQA